MSKVNRWGGERPLLAPNTIMAKVSLYFQDLPPAVQDDLWSQVGEELLARTEVEYRHEDESEEQFQTRLYEEIDHYINTHNDVQEFVL